MSARTIFQSFSGLSNAIISVSSADLSFPVRRLRSTSPSSRWRSKLGWNIVAGFNAKFDFTEATSGDAVATLTATNYASGQSLAAALTIQMNLVATDNTYSVTYDSSTAKFTIARATGSTAFGIEWSTGTNTAISVGKCLGFSIAADDTGSTSYVSDNVTYHSREFIVIETQTAVTGAFAGTIGGNFLSTATITVQANASDAWVSPSVSETMAATTSTVPMRIDYFAEATHAFWRLLIEDTTNTAGFSELAVFHVSNFIEPSYDFNASWTEGRSELTGIGYADQGANFIDEKPTRRIYNVSFPALSESEKTNSFDPFLSFVKIGKPFFFSFEPDSDVTFTRYVMLTKASTYRRVPGANRWALSLSLSEVLG